MNTEEMIEVLRAKDDGVELQYRWLNSQQALWGDRTGNPLGNLNFAKYEYRVKPKKGFDAWWNGLHPATNVANTKVVAKNAWNAAQEEMKDEH